MMANVPGSHTVMLNFVPTLSSIPPKDVCLRLKELPNLPTNIQPLVGSSSNHRLNVFVDFTWY